MRIAELINPEDDTDDDDSSVITESKSPRHKSPHSAALEIVYKRIKDGNPPTKLLNELMQNYPSISSLIYLRSWFNNRHNKYKRYVNLRREKLIELLRLYSNCTIEHQKETIKLNEPLEVNQINVACSLLKSMQHSTAKYLVLINKLDD